MSYSSTQINKLLNSLEKHLADEHPDNPILAKAVKSFRKLDYVGYGMGLIGRDESYATCVTWWPMIAVLGTFSAGKSTFINSHLGMKLQRTGTQAVDDKFTVICYSRHNEAKTLPGVALDADPRFPFFHISKSIEEISETGQERIDAYLQLKTCPSESVRGKIIIDSPGFDADSQRASTLRLTQHIINLSDLVLVFFDARHPEPKAMQDTLAYLVSASVSRADANKFLYILNQIDVTAQEDNPEEVVSAWQRSLAEVGLIAGRFYRIYNPEAAVPIGNAKIKERFEKKREEDMADIQKRMQQIEVERAYRIVGKLEQTAKSLKNQVVEKLTQMLGEWKNKVLMFDGILLVTLAALAGAGLHYTDSWDLLNQLVPGNETFSLTALGVLLVVVGYSHFTVRKAVANNIKKKLEQEMGHDHEACKQLIQAFSKSTLPYRTMLFKKPAGWNEVTASTIDEIVDEANDYIQELNDQFTNPSGNEGENAQVSHH